MCCVYVLCVCFVYGLLCCVYRLMLSLCVVRESF
jgi:hypothetical protein